jgi:hypothetical protein
VSNFFDHPAGFDVDLLLWSARERDRVEIMRAIDDLPRGEPHVLALAPELARALAGEALELPVLVDPELISFSWELRPAT